MLTTIMEFQGISKKIKILKRTADAVESGF
jgi:hypothetical protein